MLSRASSVSVLHIMQWLIANIWSCLMQGQMPSILLAFISSSFYLLPILISQTVWKHLHIKLPKIILYLMHLFIKRFSWKFKTGTIIALLFIQIVHPGNSVACATIFPSNSNFHEIARFHISIKCQSLPIIKVWKQIKDSIASKYIIFIDSISCLQALQYMKLEHTLIRMVIQKCLSILPIKMFLFLLGIQSYWY